MTMKRKLAVLLCSMPFAAMPVAFAQTGGTTEGTTSPQSGSQTDMGVDGAPNQGTTNGAGNNTSGDNTSTGGASSGASTSGSGSAAGSTGASTGGSGSTTSSTGATGGDGATGSSTGSGSSSSGASDSGSSAGGTSGTTTSSSTNGASSTSGASSTTGTSGSTATTADPKAGDSFQKKLQGESVHNENDEKVGDVKDVVMSSDGKVTHVILGVGGFIGVGEHVVAIPYDEIQTSGDKLILRGYTKDQLKDMPAYEYPREDRAPATAGGSGTPASPMGAPR